MWEFFTHNRNQAEEICGDISKSIKEIDVYKVLYTSDIRYIFALFKVPICLVFLHMNVCPFYMLKNKEDETNCSFLFPLFGTHQIFRIKELPVQETEATS